MQRKYLSDTDKNYKCLEDYLREGEFGDLPDENLHKSQHDKTNTKLILEEVKRNNPKFLKLDKNNTFSNIESSLETLTLPTRYDSPWGYHLINSLIEQIKETAEDFKIETTDFPLHATVPTGQVNAMAVNLNCSSRKFLLFDPQLLMFCNIIAKLYAQCLSPNEMSRSANVKILRAVISSTPEIAQRLKGLLAAFIKNGRPGTSPPFPVDTISAQLSHRLTKGMELFVVAHEFGHVYSGHLSDLLSKSYIITPTPEQVASHKNEYEADYIAFILTTHALKKEGWDLWLIVASIKLFFSSLDLADRYADYISYGPNRKFFSEESETHPSNENRVKAIKKIVNNLDHTPEELRILEQFETLIDEATELLWTDIMTTKTGKNELCPCGSRKKYKKCCGA
ncbi:hypothetical protein PSCICN_03480 [Pseudomonas cichorii]|uniref:SEC-C metal-binding domain-containing protein n=1 Tax=Pseudomonas cichorii TaxID=36746 RepID=UPI001910ED7B|nr:SEC-C metal-binding domain-containing protein [Pseudomonas cichorii]GFM79656.1 hypothetical protein PSCICN_03480 [Pseudomonas cichorii]